MRTELLSQWPKFPRGTESLESTSQLPWGPSPRGQGPSTRADDMTPMQRRWSGSAAGPTARMPPGRPLPSASRRLCHGLGAAAPYCTAGAAETQGRGSSIMGAGHLSPRGSTRVATAARHSGAPARYRLEHKLPSGRPAQRPRPAPQPEHRRRCRLQTRLNHIQPQRQVKEKEGLQY